MQSKAGRAILLGAASVLAACSRSPAASTSGESALAHAPPSAASAPAEAAASAPAEAAASAPAEAALADAYRGTIGKARIVVRLHATGEKVTGRYFYEAVGDALALAGTVAGGHVALSETSRAGKVTGVFDGQRDASGAIAGTWQAPDKSHPTPFTLTPIPRSGGPAPVLVFKRAFHNLGKATEPSPAGASDAPAACDIKVEYPEVFGLASAEVEAKINDALSAEKERQCSDACQGEVNYEVTLNRDGVLSLEVGGSHACASAPYPWNFEGFYANFLTTTGEQLGLEQVFKRPFAAHTKKLFQSAMAASSAHGDGTDSDDREMLATEFESPEFLFVDGGVRFSVVRKLPHVAQALGATPTTLTFAQVKDALDPSSPVAFLWRR